MRVLALPRYERDAASTRQRFLQYEPHLREAGISVDFAPLLDNDHLHRINRGEGRSITSAARAYARRVRHLFQARRYDALWIYCELFPYLPGMFELIGPMLGKPILYDCDDAIFHNYDRSPNAAVRALLAGKLEPLLRRAAACACGNAYLRDYAARFCDNSVILPTVVDTEAYVPRPRATTASDRPPLIGWIGSPSTWINVRPLLPILNSLVDSGRARVRVVGAGSQAEQDQFPGLEMVDWSEASEILEVQNMDIGIMPLIDLPFQRGKSGFKLIQYMACALPAVASPVGVNSEIIVPGETGYLAGSNEEWEATLGRLLDDTDLRRRMGEAGRQRAEEHYSLAVHGPRLVALLRSVVGGEPGAR
jgi:glycosyltransferase involved in cell wall biosynthesis